MYYCLLYIGFFNSMKEEGTNEKLTNKIITMINEKIHLDDIVLGSINRKLLVIQQDYQQIKFENKVMIWVLLSNFIFTLLKYMMR